MSRHTLKGLCLFAICTVPTMAQNGPGPRGQGGAGGPQQQRQGSQGRADAELKAALDASDATWKTLQPKIAAVQALQADVAVGHAMAMGGGMGGPPGMGGGPGGPGGPGMGGPAMGMGGPRGGFDRGGHPPEGGPGPSTRPTNASASAVPQDADHPHHAGGPGGHDGPGQHANAKPSKVMERFLDLQEALDDKDAKSEDLKAKIEAFHQARDESRAALTKAETDLRGMVNPMQEAVLITMGVLD